MSIHSNVINISDVSDFQLTRLSNKHLNKNNQYNTIPPYFRDAVTQLLSALSAVKRDDILEQVCRAFKPEIGTLISLLYFCFFLTNVRDILLFGSKHLLTYPGLKKTCLNCECHISFLHTYLAAFLAGLVFHFPAHGLYGRGTNRADSPSRAGSYQMEGIPPL